MRWPLPRRPRPTEHTPVVPADAPALPLVDTSDDTNVVPAPTGPPVASHLGSRPRADWAHLAPVVTTTRSAPPLTFDGGGFGRSVAGSRSMTERRHAAPGRGPAGLLVDAARVDAVLTPADAPDTTALGDGAVHQGVQALAHRKPAVAPAATRDLLTSDTDVEFPRTELGGPPPAAVSWTPEGGFVEDDEPTRAPTRIIRRPRLGEGDDTDAPQGDDGDEHDDGSTPALRFVAAPGPRRVPAPRDLADLVEQHTGVNVADAEIDRSPAVSARAAQLGAIAFTEHGTVHLPDELGPLDDPAVRAVAAHELVHVAQQRARGGAPSEDSHEGRELEQQARAVQHRVATDAVRPTFLRRGADAPTGPSGVQRLTSEDPDWVGVDLSEQDFSHVEPRSASDPFAWQERDGEPTGDWEARRRWDETFERDNATTLQRRRDERYAELLGAGAHGADEIHAARLQLEQEMPYQFGPPFGIAPYPDAAPTGAGAAGAAGAASISTARESAAATAALTARREAPLVHRTSGQADRGDLDDVLAERFQLERDLRLQVLEAKRRAAVAEGASAGHVVQITMGELEEIRRTVELELPLEVPYPQYLETEENLTMSMSGEPDVRPPAEGASRPGGGAASTAGGVAAGLPGATTRSSPGTGGAAGAGVAPHAAGAAPTAHTDGAAGSAGAPGAAGTGGVSALLQSLHAAHHTEPVPDAHVHGGDLVDRFELRFDREREYRRAVLRDRVQTALEGGATSGTSVLLTMQDVQEIRAMVDTELPVDVPYPQYLETDEELVHVITPHDVEQHHAAHPAAHPATHPAAAAAAPTAAPAPAAAPATTAHATPAAPAAPTPHDEHPAHQATAGGEHATADAYADHAAAARIVEHLTDQDVDLLSRRVWSRLRRELRGELLLDRERSGTLADLR